jgi:hypothetical protein
VLIASVKQEAKDETIPPIPTHREDDHQDSGTFMLTEVGPPRRERLRLASQETGNS